MVLDTTLKTAIVAWLLVGAAIYLKSWMDLALALLVKRLNAKQSLILAALARGLMIAMMLGPLAILRDKIKIEKGRHDD